MKKKELIFSVTRKDLTVQTFRSGGPGGQHQNKTESGIRITHKDSGAVGESRNHKSQYQNKRTALKRLASDQRFRLWVHRRVWEITEGKTLEQRVEEQLVSKNLKIEIVGEDGRWEAI